MLNVPKPSPSICLLICGHNEICAAVLWPSQLDKIRAIKPTSDCHITSLQLRRVKNGTDSLCCRVAPFKSVTIVQEASGLIRPERHRHKPKGCDTQQLNKTWFQHTSSSLFNVGAFCCQCHASKDSFSDQMCEWVFRCRLQTLQSPIVCHCPTVRYFHSSVHKSNY